LIVTNIADLLGATGNRKGSETPKSTNEFAIFGVIRDIPSPMPKLKRPKLSKV